MELQELLAFAKKHEASDLHVVSNRTPYLRVHGEMIPIRVAPLSADDVTHMLHHAMNQAQRDEYEKNLELDFSLYFENVGRFRANAFNTLEGPALSLRDIPDHVKTFEELRMPVGLERFGRLTRGLVLVTGPTGSGKSTTLAAILDYINHHYAKHILTIEDPIEFVHTADHSLINQREVGSHTRSFKQALRSALREDPDVIMVGELRDLETIRLALTAAETGHLVLATLHTSSASKTIDRIIDVFPEGDKEMARTMLATSLEAIITQILVKRADGGGRVPAHEILVANPAIRNLIRDNKIPQIYSIMQVGSKLGMHVMKDCIHELVSQNIITSDVARNALNMTSEESDGSSLGEGADF